MLRAGDRLIVRAFCPRGHTWTSEALVRRFFDRNRVPVIRETLETPVCPECFCRYTHFSDARHGRTDLG